MKWETILAWDINKSMALGIDSWEEVMLAHMGWIQARKFSQPLVRDVYLCYNYSSGFDIFICHLCISLLMLKVF